MKKMLPILSSLLLVFSSIGASVFAEKSCNMEKPHHMWAELNLSDDQKSKLKVLHKEMQESRKEMVEKMKAIRIKTKDELVKQSPSKNVLYDYAKEMGDLHRQSAEKFADHLLKVKGILTPEQFAKIADKHCGLANEGMKGKGMGCKMMKKEGGHGKCPHGHGAGVEE